MNEPLSPAAARKLIHSVVGGAGDVVISPHAQRQMEERRISRDRVLNTLRAGAVQPGEWENGSWRYPVDAYEIRVVVAFDGERVVVVVTAIRRR